MTICSLDDEVTKISELKFNPSNQDLFTYLGDLRKAIRALDDVNIRLPPESRVVLGEAYLRGRLVRAARQSPIYKPVRLNLANNERGRAAAAAAIFLLPWGST